MRRPSSPRPSLYGWTAVIALLCLVPLPTLGQDAPASGANAESTPDAQTPEAQAAASKELEATVAEMAESMRALQAQVQRLEQENAAARKRSDDAEARRAQAAEAKANDDADAQKAQSRSARTKALSDRPATLRARDTIRGEHQAAPRPGNTPVQPEYPGFFPLGETGTWAKFGGYVKLDTMADSAKMGNPNKFATSSIGVDSDPDLDQANQFNMHAKQTRFSLESRTPTPLGSLRVLYENDFYANGTSPTMGYNLRHFYGQLANVTVGQTWTAFLDTDAIPDTLDFAGPGVQAIHRQPQLRYTQALGADYMHVALGAEQPGSDLTDPAQAGSARNVMPDFTANFRLEGTPGHLHVAGVARMLAYEQASGVRDATFGWGANLSGVVHVFRKDAIVANLTLGQGLGRYAQDFGTGNAGVVGPNGKVHALSSIGGFAGYRHFWTDKWRSQATYGYLQLDSRTEQGGDAYGHTHYAQGNVIWSPDPRFNLGIEYLFGRKATLDGSVGDAHRGQFSVQFKVF